MASNLEQSAGDLFGAGAIPAERRFFSLAPGGMGTGMTIGDKYNHLLRLQKERSDVLSNMAGAQRSELDLMNTTQDIINLRNRHNVLDELDKLSFRDNDLPEKLSQFDRAQLMDPIVAKKVSNLAGRNANYEQGRTQIVQSLYDSGIPKGGYFDSQYDAATDMLNSYDTPGLAKFFANANRTKIALAAQREQAVFESRETFKHSLAGGTKLSTRYMKLKEDLTGLTTDVVPPDFIKAYSPFLEAGMPFPQGKTEKGRLHTIGEDGTSSTSEIDITLIDKLTSEFINTQFMFFAEELENINIEQDPEGIWKLKEAGSKSSKPSKSSGVNPQVQRKADWKEYRGGLAMPKQERGFYSNKLIEDEFRDASGNIKPPPAEPDAPDAPKSVSTLSALRRPETIVGQDLLLYFRERAQNTDLNTFLALMANEKEGLSKAVADLAAVTKGDAAISWQLMADFIDSKKEQIEPAKNLLTSIHNFVNNIHKIDRRTQQAFRGSDGQKFMNHVATVHLTGIDLAKIYDKEVRNEEAMEAIEAKATAKTDADMGLIKEAAEKK